MAKLAALITDWRAVSPFLGLTEAEEIAILGSNPHSVPAQKIAMLRKWKQKLGAKATYKRLCRVFRECGSRDLEEKVTELLVAESSSSSDEEGEKQNWEEYLWAGLVNLYCGLTGYNFRHCSIITHCRYGRTNQTALTSLTHCVCGQTQESLPKSTYNMASTTELQAHQTGSD